jgi:hypothetical protein
LSYKEDALGHFHTFNDDFLLGKASKKVQAKPNALRSKLVKNQMVNERANVEPWTPFKKQCELNSWHDFISHEIDVAKELNTDFNFPKSPMISHWV